LKKKCGVFRGKTDFNKGNVGEKNRSKLSDRGLKRPHDQKLAKKEEVALGTGT